MSRIILLRHAQASFADGGSITDGYDQLSPLGYRQSAALAEELAESGTVFDRVVMGPAKRHRQTAETVEALYEARGLPWPEPQVIDALDEHQGAFVMTRALEHTDGDAELADLAAGLAADGEARVLAFFQVYRVVSERWAREELSDEVSGEESWKAFRRRVEGALQRVIDESEDGETVGVFTSGGPICAGAAWVLGLDDVKAMELTWVMRNASMTELLYPFGRVVLGSFNTLPRFDSPNMVTYV
ncbi:MAG: histidine phosphatase family protein [Gemmatimonadota bacterium]|nr:MAG: histidine phosphatase family protein [Gemmatimonadota bacterium]